MPVGNLLLDQAGNLYGWCSGQLGYGGVCELMPSNGGWTDKLLYSFTDYGYNPVLAGNDGDLYGINSYGGDHQLGLVFQLVPSGNGWILNTIHDFDGQSDGSIPMNLFQDVYGNLYGDSIAPGGYWNGMSVFKLTPTNGQWVFNIIWQTQPGESITAVGMDSDRLYGIGGVVTGGSCGGQDCAGSDPAASAYYYGFFAPWLLQRFSGNGLFFASGLVVGPGGQVMWGETSNCGVFNNGTLWYWQN
jgi:hypothetical protein